ncbi:MAG: polysaccharide deacetylase family protein [Nitrospiraceae bacterium]|nr:MAG: polysaccharide deacetylase family protein [Nitrospiraceae bacterium]
MLHDNPVTILCAHRVIDGAGRKSVLDEMYLKGSQLELADLEKKLGFLKKKYKFISISDYLKAFENGKRLPANSLILTFDDGYIEHYNDVYPLLKRLGIPASFFIATDYVSETDCKWDDKIAAMIARAKVKEFVLDTHLTGKRKFEIGNVEGKARAAGYLWRALKYAGVDERTDLICDLEKALGLTGSGSDNGAYRMTVSWENVKALADDPLMEVGAHTRTHPVLAGLTDEELRDELSASKKEIEERTGKTVSVLCYPYGKKYDYDERAKKFAKDAGFRAALSLDYGRNNGGTDLFALRRLPLLPEPMTIFKVRLSGILDFISAKRESVSHARAAVHQD